MNYPKNVLPIARSGYYRNLAMAYGANYSIRNEHLRYRSHIEPNILMHSRGHITTVRGTMNLSAVDFQRRYCQNRLRPKQTNEATEAFKQPLIFLGGQHLREVAPDTLSEIHPDVIKAFGTPIDLPVHPSLSHNVERQVNYTEQNLLHASICWIDTRGTLAHVGAGHRALVAKSGRRMALVPNQNIFRTMKANQHVEWKLRAVSAKQAAQPGTYFLYRQPLDVWNFHTNSFDRKYWIGLATCMNYNAAKKKDYGLHVLAQQVVEFAQFQSLLFSKNADSVTPLDRYIKQPKPMPWDREHWQRLAEAKDSQYMCPVRKDVLSIINACEALTLSPAALLLKRLEEQHQQKRQEVDATESILLNAQASYNYNLKHIQQLEETILQYQKELQKKSAENPAYERTIATHSKKLPMQKLIADKIQAARDKKKAAFELEKTRYIETIGKQADNGLLPGFAEGLAKSGIVITDIVYKKKDCRERKKASENREITMDPQWEMETVHLETNRPIPIVFGLDEAGLPPRISGPHKISVTCKGGNVSCKIGCLTPWSIIGIQNGHFKSYPHMPWRKFDNTSPEAFLQGLMAPSDVCMGELAASTASAFRHNSPKQVALAVLSFIQSSDPDDGYGRSYKQFPLASDYKGETLTPGKMVKMTPTTPAIDVWYWVADNKHYVSVEADRFKVRWGDLEVRDGVLTEINSSETDHTIHDHAVLLNNCISGNWQHYGIGYRERDHQGEPTWNYRNGQPQTVTIDVNAPSDLLQ